MSNLAPMLPASYGSLRPAGCRSPNASFLFSVQTSAVSFGAAGSSPVGAALPAARQSLISPCLKGENS